MGGKGLGAARFGRMFAGCFGHGPIAAGVAELADARDLGSRGREAVQVRFLSPALMRECAEVDRGFALCVHGRHGWPKALSNAARSSMPVMPSAFTSPVSLLP